MAAAGVSAASASTTSPTRRQLRRPSARAKAGANAGLHDLGSFLQIKADSQQAAGERAAGAATALHKKFWTIWCSYK
jgi:hypothetical protein